LEDELEIEDSHEYYDCEERKVSDMLHTIDVWIQSAQQRLEKTLETGVMNHRVWTRVRVRVTVRVTVRVIVRVMVRPKSDPGSQGLFVLRQNFS